MNIQMKVRSLEKVRLFIKKNQILMITTLLAYALGLKSYTHHFLHLARNIIRLWETMGRKALISYLKECVRATVQFIAGQQYVRNNIPIKLSKTGLPKIIPGPLRTRIALIKKGVETQESLLILRAVLSILQVYRTIKVPGLVAEISTVTGPYTGTVQTLFKEVKAVSAYFPKLSVRKGNSWSISETSGPNSPLATWGSLADVFALAWDHNTFINLIKYGISRRAYSLLLWLLVLYSIVNTFYGLSIFFIFNLVLKYPTMGPYVFLILLFLYIRVFWGIKWVTGRLATFEEGGGKVRIVAIFDQWSQWLLQPLHEGIFDLFKLLPSDGTHDQLKPLNALMEHIRLGHPAYSFDLTAATDRIPLWLQIEVLKGFKFKSADLWGKLIADRSFRITNGFKDSINKSIVAEVSSINFTRGKGCDIRYSVGQPMGAYSSWAVMALTHHVLVQIAAKRAKYIGYFPHYALLGDDIVIADKAVAMEYLNIMKEIGVGVNRLKSIESDHGTVEFAKRWIHPHLGEFSPIGAKLLLAVAKNVTMLPALFTEMAYKGITLYPSSFVAVLQGLLKIRGGKLSPEFLRDIEVAALAPNGILDKGHMISEWMNLWIFRITGSTVDDFVIRNMMIKSYWDKQIASVDARPAENLAYFIKYFIRTPMIRGRLTAWLLQPMLIITPAFWLYLKELIRAFNEPSSFSLQMYGIVNAHDPNARKHISLSMMPEHAFNRSIDWRERGVVAKHTIALKEYGNALRGVSIPSETGPILLLSDGS